MVSSAGTGSAVTNVIPDYFGAFLTVVLLLQAEGSCFHSCCSLLVHCSQHHPGDEAKEHSSVLPTISLNFFQDLTLFFFLSKILRGQI